MRNNNSFRIAAPRRNVPARSSAVCRGLCGSKRFPPSSGEHLPEPGGKRFAFQVLYPVTLRSGARHAHIWAMGDGRKSVAFRNSIAAIARVLLPEIQAFFESEDGQREYAEWNAKQQAEQKNKA